MRIERKRLEQAVREMIVYFEDFEGPVEIDEEDLDLARKVAGILGIDDERTKHVSWTACQVAFEVDDEIPLAAWTRPDGRKPSLPAGWSFDGIHVEENLPLKLAVLRVNGEPRAEDGDKVRALLVHVGAIRMRKRFNKGA
jgi:hypothetical protein